MKKVVISLKRIHVEPLFLLMVIIFCTSCKNTYLNRVIGYNIPTIDEYHIFPKKQVEANHCQPWEMATCYNQYQLSEDNLNYLKKYGTVAYLVIHDKKILYERYLGDWDKDSLSNGFSMSKSILGLLTGCALQEGKIDSLDQKIADFIVEYRKDDRSKISVRDVLTMSTGLEWSENYFNPWSAASKAYYGYNLKEQVLNMELIEEPGDFFHYYSGYSQVLSFVLEEATGMTISQYASEKLWKPIGACRDALWSLDKPGGNEKAFCCFISNARDFARIGQLVNNEGKWNGKRVIQSDYIHEMVSPALHLKNKDNENLFYYGFQWWLGVHDSIPFAYARGMFGQYIISIPREDLVIVRLGHRRSFFHPDGHNSKDLFRYIEMAKKIKNSSLNMDGSN